MLCFEQRIVIAVASILNISSYSNFCTQLGFQRLMTSDISEDSIVETSSEHSEYDGKSIFEIIIFPCKILQYDWLRSI
jgi:hypothetical protein